MGSKVPVYCSLRCKAEGQRRSKRITKEWLEQKYLVEKMSTYDISKIVKRNPKQVYWWLKGYYIPTRPRGENLKNTDDNYMKRKNVCNPFKGKKHSEKAKAIMSQKATCPRPHLRGDKNGMYGKRGSQVPNWKGGCTPERQSFYSSPEWTKVAPKVWKRDKGICQRCHKHHVDCEQIHIHHIISFQIKAVRAKLSNLTLLCNKCHRWVHSSKNIAGEFLA
jgi:hypothetical protein